MTLCFGHTLWLEKGLYNPNRVKFDAIIRATGKTVRVLMPLFFLVDYVRFGLGLG